MTDLAFDRIDTLDNIEAELLVLEAKIAARMEIDGPVRAFLLQQSCDGTLHETKLIAEWHALYAIYAELVPQ